MEQNYKTFRDFVYNQELCQQPLRRVLILQQNNLMNNLVSWNLNLFYAVYFFKYIHFNYRHEIGKKLCPNN